MPPARKEARPSSRVGRARTPAFVKNIRGVKNWKEVSGWLEWRGIEDIECITPDQAGVARGKMMPSNKFTSNTSLALPSALFMMTISGDYPENGNGFAYPEDDGDLKLMPDLSTLSVVPWETDPTAQVIYDLVDQDGRYVEFAPRNVLRRVLPPTTSRADAGRRAGARVLPRAHEHRPRLPAEAADRPLGPRETSRQAYRIDAVNEFDPLFEDVYDYCEAQGSTSTR